MPKHTIEQRLKSLLSNLEAAATMTPPTAPHLMLILQVKELAEIVEQLTHKEAADPLPVYGSKPLH